MRRVGAGWQGRGWGALLAWLLPMVVAAQTFDLREVSIFFQPGDDLAWAATDVDHAAWERVSLPHRWHPSATGSARGWYRFTLPAAALQASGGLALDLGILGYLAEVDVDGEKIGQNGDFARHLGPTEFQPDVFPLPAGLAADGQGVAVAVRVYTMWGPGGWLQGPWVVGPAAERLERAMQLGLQRWFVVIALAVMLVFWALLFAFLVARRPQDRAARWGLVLFGALAGFWGSFYLPSPALGWAWGDGGVAVIGLAGQLAFSAALVAGPQFVAALLGARVPRWGGRVLLGLVAVAFVGDWAALGIQAAWLGSLLGWGRFFSLRLVAGLVAFLLGRGVALAVPGARTLGVGCATVAALYALDVAGFLWPMPLYLAEWLPVGTSRAALIFFGEVGLFVLAFAVGQTVLDQHVAREKLVARLGESLAHSRQHERDHLARELHDGVQPRLAALRLHLHRVGKRRDDPAVLAQAEATLSGLQGELRATLDGMRVPWLNGRRLPAALQALVAEWDAARLVALEAALPADGALPPHLEDAVFRFFQEALANALRHAAATKITLALRLHGGDWEFACRDNGLGFVVADVHRGYGLTSMRERVESLGGTFSIDSGAKAGTVVRWLQPVNRVAPGSGS